MNDPFSYRDMLFSVSAIALFAAILICAFTGGRANALCVVTGVTVLAVVGAAFAYGLKELGYSILPGIWQPWYARSWASVLLVLAFVALAGVWDLVDSSMTAGSPFARAVPWFARLLTLVGTALGAIPLWDYPRGRRAPRRAMRSNNQPVFRPFASATPMLPLRDSEPEWVALAQHHPSDAELDFADMSAPPAGIAFTSTSNRISNDGVCDE